MKVGDLIKFSLPNSRASGASKSSRDFKLFVTGVVVAFPPVVHYKQFQEVTVLTERGLENWVKGFCEVIR